MLWYFDLATRRPDVQYFKKLHDVRYFEKLPEALYFEKLHVVLAFAKGQELLRVPHAPHLLHGLRL